MERFDYQQWMSDVFSAAMETSYSLTAPFRLFRLFYRGEWRQIRRETVSVY